MESISATAIEDEPNNQGGKRLLRIRTNNLPPKLLVEDQDDPTDGIANVILTRMNASKCLEHKVTTGLRDI